MNTIENMRDIGVDELHSLKSAIRTYSYRENHEQLFSLASGKKSPYYFDLKQTLLRPQYLAIAGRIMFEKLQRMQLMPQIAAGLTMGADPLIYALCLEAEHNGNTILPMVVRKEAKDHGTGAQAEGALSAIEAGATGILLDDVITTGGSTLKAFYVMQKMGYEVKHAFCILDRQEGGVDAMAAMGITLHPVFTIDDFKTR